MYDCMVNSNDLRVQCHDDASVHCMKVTREVMKNIIYAMESERRSSLSGLDILRL